jgi:hypothetical protein
VRIRASVAFLLTTRLLGQQPDTVGMLEALARSAATFSRSFPQLTARETLSQKGRRGDMAILKQGRNREIKNAVFTIPETFETHEVVSEYSFGPTGENQALHEIRNILTLDGQRAMDIAAPRRTLTLGAVSADDETKKSLLENLERGQLQGSAVDFGPLLLLFTEGHQKEYTFKSVGRRFADAEAVLVLRYHQNSGTGALTEFRERSETRHPFEGEIWLRESDLLPRRVTLSAEEVLTPKYILRNEAEIDYRPTPYGLAPESVLHRQYLNQDLLVENQFRYSGYYGTPFIP